MLSPYSFYGLVSRVIGYGPEIWIRLAPSSAKRLENHTPYTGYAPSHSWLMTRGCQLKKELYSRSSHTGPPPITTEVDRQDLPTYLITVEPPHNSAYYSPPQQSRRLRPDVTRHSHRHPRTPDREALEYWVPTHQSLTYKLFHENTHKHHGHYGNR
jgi:hypothetical protein